MVKDRKWTRYSRCNMPRDAGMQDKLWNSGRSNLSLYGLGEEVASTHIFTACKRSLGQGNVFTDVCLSTGGYLPLGLGRCLPLGPDRCTSGSGGVPLDPGVCVCIHTGHTHTPWTHTHTLDTHHWTHTLGIHPRTPLDTPPPTVHKWALGHPTVMLSCFYKHETTSYLRHFPRPHFLN